MADTYEKPLPVPSAETDVFWDGCKQHKLMIPFCQACESWFFYPRPFCPKCFSWNVVDREHSGRGTLYTYAIQFRAQGPGFMRDVPYITALVELEPGVRLMTNLKVEERDPMKLMQLACDQPVEVVWDDVTPEFTLPKFRLAQGGGS
jgi:uncharacterized OB-fold protein